MAVVARMAEIEVIARDELLQFASFDAFLACPPTPTASSLGPETYDQTFRGTFDHKLPEPYDHTLPPRVDLGALAAGLAGRVEMREGYRRSAFLLRSLD